MRQMRIPVSWDHPEAGNFGFLYLWQAGTSQFKSGRQWVGQSGLVMQKV